MATVIYVMGDRRRALQELPLPEAGLKGREEVVCLQYVDLSIQLETGHKVAICPSSKITLHVDLCYKGPKVTLEGRLRYIFQESEQTEQGFFFSYKALIEPERLG